MPAPEPDNRTNGLSDQPIVTRASGASFILEGNNVQWIFSYYARQRLNARMFFPYVRAP